MMNLKVFLEFMPLLTFLVLYSYNGILVATAGLIVTSIASLGLMHYYLKSKIPSHVLFTTIILIILGSVTLLTGDPQFIKIKPTIVYTIFASILFYDYLYQKYFLKKILEPTLKLKARGWSTLALHFSLFFLLCAIMNELIWRNFDESVWVAFKVFYFPITMLIFTMLEMFYVNKKYSLKVESPSEKHI